MGFESPTAPLNGGYGNGERRREAVVEDLARRGRWRGGGRRRLRGLDGRRHASGRQGEVAARSAEAPLALCSWNATLR
jgi:hypothetical protein